MFSIVIPFYNEEACASFVIYSLIAAIRKSKLPIRLLLVNNGSIDKTETIIRNYTRRYAELSLLSIPVNKGFGYGVRKGLEKATTAYIGYMCGDGQTDPKDLISVVKTLHKDKTIDMCKVSRKSRHDGFVRRSASAIYNVVFRLLFSSNSHDINGTPKVFKRNIYRLLKPSSDDWFIDAEIMLKAYAKKLYIREIPTTFYERKTGTSSVSLSTAIEFIKNMIQYAITSDGRSVFEDQPFHG